MVDAGPGDSALVDTASADRAADASLSDAVAVDRAVSDAAAGDVPPGDSGPVTEAGSDATVDSGWDAGRPPPLDWWHSSWRHRHPIDIDTSWLDEDLRDVPMPLRLASSDLSPLDVDAEAADLRFVDDVGAALPYEIERWDPQHGSLVWVLLPEVVSGSDVHRIWLYHGNPLATDWQDADQVWRDGFEAVWHLDESLRESSGRLPPGTRAGAVEGPGILGPAMELAGDPAHAILGTNPDLLRSVSQTTLEAWVRKANPATTGNMWIVSISTFSSPPGTNSRATFAIANTDEIGVWGRPLDLGGYETLLSTTSPIQDADWHQIVGSIDLARGEMALHLDGEPLRRDSFSFASDVTHHLPPKVVVLGSQDDLSEGYLQGGIDELRVSRVLRSDAWIRFQYMAVSGAIVHLGAVDSIGQYPTGQAPQAVDDLAVTDEDTDVLVDVLANDVEPDGEALRILSFTDGASGTVGIVSGTLLHYQPFADANGQDQFSYAISDGFNGISVAQVQVTVVAVPDAPRPADDVVGVVPGGSVNVAVLDNDFEADGEVLSVSTVGTPDHGTATLQPDDRILYAPPSGYAGPARFSYRAADPGGLDAEAWVDVVVHPSAVSLRFVEEGAARGFVTADPSFGQAWADVDRDGWTDVWLGGSGRLLRNDHGSFEAWTVLAGDRGGFFADPDNDGDLDLLTTNAGSFYEWTGVDFVDVGEAAGLTGSNLGSAVWFDLDRDGWNDVFFPNGNDPFLEVRHNRGQRPVSFEVLDALTMGFPATVGNGECSTGADVDDDGDVDLWVNGATQGFLLINQGNGSFLDMSATAGVVHTYTDPYSGVAFGDCDNDGDQDLFLGHQSGRNNRLYINDGSGSFSRSNQLYWDTGKTLGVAWGDLDGDGWLDLVVANANSQDEVFLNLGNCRFVGAGDLLGLDPQRLPTTSILPVDVDNDGDLDLAIARDGVPDALWLNQLDSPDFLRVIVHGAGAGNASRDGIGTRVRLLASGGGTMLGERVVGGGEGYASHQLAPLHFGLRSAGGASASYELQIRFADGEERSVFVTPAQEQAVIGTTTLLNTVEIQQ
ncbi:MAG: DUF2341 domain-containing protein [Pseudomonadota bacterium]